MKKTPKRNQLKELAEELDVFDKMLSTLIELLEKKKILAKNEFEDLLRAKIEKTSKIRSYRDIQLDKE